MIFHKLKYMLMSKKIIREDKHSTVIVNNGEFAQYEIKIIENMLCDIIKSSRNLLIQKGFETDLDKCMIEKHVFLFSEIGELTDCVKKGRSAEEPFEIADIIIRACGYLSSNQFYKLSTEDVHLKVHNLLSDEQINIFIPCKSTDDIPQLKLLYINSIYTKCFEIRSICDCLYNCNNMQLLYLWSKIIELYCFCSFYCSNILGVSLQSAIELKMKENLKRPLKYNTKGMN